MEASPAPELRPLMDDRIFIYNFHNRVFPRKTYLCYQVERQKGDKWIPVDEIKGFLRNQDCHAEQIFLCRMASWNLDNEQNYRVTCYTSWSPCKKCADMLVTLLRENRHLHLRIFAARLYTRPYYKAGLRALKAAGAEVTIMTSKEFEHCWDNFVDHRERSFLPWEDLDVHSHRLSRRLETILQLPATFISFSIQN